MRRENSPIPFFVMDRPMSLELVKYCEIDKQKGTYGLMGQANTSKRFQNLFREFKGDNIVKAADSGVFTKNGCNLSYKKLFSIYERMDVQYGIIIDFLNDKDKTLKSAEEALEIYEKENYSFKLVGVAQGNNLEEYLDCYRGLKLLGFNHIAIGGLLKKNTNSARYVRVRDENLLVNVVREIRNRYKNDWLFLLGCYHPKRHRIFEEFNIYGGDYKGWILNYRTPETILENINRELTLFEKNLNLPCTNPCDLPCASSADTKEIVLAQKKRKKIDEDLIKLRKNRKSTNEKKKEKLELDKEILSLRKKLTMNKGEEYLRKLRLFEKILYMDEKTRREYRFKQIRAYLENEIFSFFREYLLIISCSQRKVHAFNPIPAIELYDGPFFRMIRKLKEESKFPNNIHVLIISAKYGVIGLYDLIEKYDQKMTKKKVEKLEDIIKKKIGDFLCDKNFNEVFVSMGKNYRIVLNNIDFKTPVIYANGKIGEKLSQTKEWISSKNDLSCAYDLFAVPTGSTLQKSLRQYIF